MIRPSTVNGDSTSEIDEVRSSSGHSRIVDVPAIVEQARHTAGDQLAAAWQLHVERVEQELRSGWKDYIEFVLSNVFDEISTQLARRVADDIEEQLRCSLDQALAVAQQEADAIRSRLGSRIAELESALAEEQVGHKRLVSNWQSTLANERVAATRTASEVICQAARRLRRAEEIQDWSAAILEGASHFSEKAALFQVMDGELHLLGAKAVEAEYQQAVIPFSVAAADAPALARVLETGEPQAVRPDAGQLSEALVGWVEPAGAEMAFLCPLIAGDTAEAVLVAYGHDASLNTNGLEHLSMLGMLLRKRPAPPASEPAPAPATALPPRRIVYPVSREQQELHLQAQRFARVQVSELRLFQHQEVARGRQTKHLYAVMKDVIDRCRERYAQQFLSAGSSMPDYFHVELIKTLAIGDESLLGPEYPGPLV